MPRLADDESIADELEASSHIHPANDPTSHINPFKLPAGDDASDGGVMTASRPQQSEKGWTAPEQTRAVVDGDMSRIESGLALALAGIVVVCAVAAISRIAWQMWRDQEGQGRKTRRLRRLLVIGLLVADAVVAISTIHPALATLHPSYASSCASGIILSIGLWWQYTLSLGIAGITLLSLRYPLSRIFCFIASNPTAIFPPLLFISILPSLLWYGLHGYSSSGGFCFYGSSTDIGAEIMLFVPRIVFSVAISAIYSPLIPFLARPDIGAAYMDTNSSDGQRSRSRSRSLTASLNGLTTPMRQSTSKQTFEQDQPAEDIPAWEKLSFPNYDELTSSRSKHLSSVSMVSIKSLGRSRSTSGDGTLQVAISPDMSTPGGRPPQSREVWRGHQRSETLPHGALSTFLPPATAESTRPASRLSRPHTAAAAAAFGAGAVPPRVTFLDMLDDAPNQEKHTPRRCRANTVSSAVIPATPGDLLSPQVVDGRDRLSSFDSQATATETPSRLGSVYFPGLEERRGSNSSDGTAVSTDTMSTAATATSSNRDERRISDERPQAKESMDSYMRRQTRLFLIWFPLIHGLIAGLTLTRFVYGAVKVVDGPIIGILTMLLVMAPGAFDIVMFGLIEQRTKQKYRREVDACQNPAVSSGDVC